MSPLGLPGIPSDVVASLKLLPDLSRHLEVIAETTGALPEMLEHIEGMRSDTEALPRLHADMRKVAAATARLRAILERIEGIESAMPALVEVQQQLVDLPVTLGRLGDGIEKLSVTLDQLLASLGGLDQNVATLHTAVEPLGRVADRLPRRGKA